MSKKNEVIMHRHYGAIDIGSNAARLLIKRFEKVDGEVSSSKELMLRVPLRLGFEVFDKDKISKEKEKQLLHLIKSFQHLMKIYNVKEYMAYATSALRDADNGRSIVKRIKDKTGVNIHIINGLKEAKGIYDNHSERSGIGNYMYVDVGGGSTEISMISNGVLISSHSYNIGTIRILNNVVKDEEWKKMETDITEMAGLYSGINIIGSGGNINKLYRLIENRDKKRQRVTVKSLSDLCNEMADMTIQERVYHYGMKYDRADVIVPAGSIFLAIAEIIKAKYIYVPTIGLADGMINALFLKDMKKYNKCCDCKTFEDSEKGNDENGVNEEDDVEVTGMTEDEIKEGSNILSETVADDTAGENERGEKE